jgi:hypothetical protein
MIKLKAWKAAYGRGIIHYDDPTEIGEILDIMHNVEGAGDKFKITIVSKLAEDIEYIKHKYPNFNVTTPLEFRHSLDKWLIIVLNPINFMDLESEIVANATSKYYMVLADAENIPKRKPISFYSRFKSIVIRAVDNRPTSYYHTVLKFEGEEATLFEKLNTVMGEIMDTFNSFDDILGCIAGANGLNPKDYRAKLASDKGWSQDMDVTLPLIADIARIYHPDAIFERADMYKRLLNEHTDLMSNNDSIVKYVTNFYNAHPNSKILVISKNGRVNDKINNGIKASASIHSKMEKQPMFNDKGNDYIRYGTGNKKGEIKLFGTTTLTDHYVKMFNISSEINMLLITGSIAPNLYLNKVDFVIITSNKTLDYIDMKNRLKSLYSPVVLTLLMDYQKLINAYKYATNKANRQSELINSDNYL